MRKLMVRVFFGECFLIFWNIFMALTEEDTTTIWEQPFEPNFTKPNETAIILHLENDLRDMLDVNETKTFIFYHNHNESQSISFFITPCKTAEMRWTLKYKQPNETSEVIDHNFPMEMLHEYRGTDYHTYVGPARPGIYVLELGSVERRSMYSIYVTVNPSAAELLRHVDEKKRKGLIFRKSLKNLSLCAVWPEWSWKDEIIKYVVTWNNVKYTSSACEIEAYRNTHFVTTKNKQYEISQNQIITPGDAFFFRVFIKIKNDFLFPYLQGHVTFPKNKPITLKDGFPIKHDFTPDDDKIAFRYKVRNRPFPGSVNEILWYVISCSGTVHVEINHRKDSILKKQAVLRYKSFKISQPKKGNRYVLKLSDGSNELSRQVEVFATMRSEKFPFPNVTNLNLKLYSNKNYDVKDKISYTVAWSAATDDKPVHYCMQVFSKQDDDDDGNFLEINQCNVKQKLKNLKNQNRLVMRNCTRIEKSPSSILTQHIFNLDPLTDYVVFLSARKIQSKRRLWYNVEHIHGNHLSFLN